MIQPTRSTTEIKVGDKLPALERRFSAVDLVAYGGATWDWNRLHYDIEHARAMKLPGAIVDGQAFGALLARAALDWAGPRAFITRLSFRMKSMAFAGDTLLAAGEVIAVHERTVVLAQRLTNAGRLAAEATTELRLPQ